MAMMITMASAMVEMVASILAIVATLAMMLAVVSIFGAVILANVSKSRVVEKERETLSNRCLNHPVAEMGVFRYH